MSYSFTNEGEMNEAIKSELRNLNSEYVYCPKCGTKNFLIKSVSESVLNQFCTLCGVRLNDYWESYFSEQIRLVECMSCLEPTFESFNYCISCGYKQKRVTLSAKSNTRKDRNNFLSVMNDLFFSGYRSRNNKARRQRIKQEFEGRKVAWVIYVRCAIFAAFSLLTGAILIYPFALLKASNDTATFEILLITGFTLIGISLLSLCIIIPIILMVVVMKNIKERKKEIEKEKINETEKIK
ncbi:MAG TPA: hypothetical protein VMX55_12785 [candidate division Zixibacteria bacterium]|nr:hypothetical protein [candidate division Zixibacteria bacterium]